MKSQSRTSTKRIKERKYDRKRRQTRGKWFKVTWNEGHKRGIQGDMGITPTDKKMTPQPQNRKLCKASSNQINSMTERWKDRKNVKWCVGGGRGGQEKADGRNRRNKAWIECVRKIVKNRREKENGACKNTDGEWERDRMWGRYMLIVWFSRQ